MLNHACPECGEESSSSYQLAVHLAGNHLKCHGYVFSMRCWCGFQMGRNALTALAYHLAKNGGATAHYLACSLGVDDA